MITTEYDPAVDAGYIHLTKTQIVDSEEIWDGIILDYDIHKNIVGIEVLSIHSQKDNELHKLPHHIQQPVLNFILQIKQNQFTSQSAI